MGWRRGAGHFSESELPLTCMAEGRWGSCPQNASLSDPLVWYCWPHHPAHLPPPLWVGGLLIVLFGSFGTRNFSVLNAKLVNHEFLDARKILRMAELREGEHAPYPNLGYIVLSPNN